MEVKRVKCSNCGIILEVKNSKNEAVKLITCPQCKAPLRVRFQPQQPLEVETILPGRQQRVAPQNDGETLLGGRQDSERTILGQGRQQGAATACLVLAGQQYVLRQGANTVGRKAQTSQATLQLPVSDPYMSRHHLQITVSVLPNGKLKAVISNDRNKNITSINGVELPHDEAIVLSNGDRIVMGKTTVVYQETISHENSNQTAPGHL